MTKRQSGLLQDALVLLHTDIAMVREGFHLMTDWEVEKVSSIYRVLFIPLMTWQSDNQVSYKMP